LGLDSCEVSADFASELERELAAFKDGRKVPTSITRCMVRLDGVWITPDAALDEITRLRAEVAQRTADLAKANAERDEARRQVCNLSGGFDRKQKRRVAESLGWDCFKEEA
jgi:hypothetical protein